MQTILNHGNVDELPAEAKGYFNQQKQLMEYYVVQLNLFGDMAMDRSYNAIEQLEEELRYDVLVRMLVNDLLPDAIRAAATTLVLRLYVDRFPHQSLQAPQCVHVLPEIAPVSDLQLTTSKKDVLPAYCMTPELITDRMVDEEKELRMEFLRYGLKSAEKPSDKFSLLQDYISRHLGGTQRQSPADIERNRFTLSIVNVLIKLLDLGFYANYHRLKDVVDKAVGVLNGKKDDPGTTANPDASSLVESSPSNHILPRHRVVTMGDHMVVQVKQRIITALIRVTKLRDDYRLKLLMAKFVEHNGGTPRKSGVEEAKSSSEPKQQQQQQQQQDQRSEPDLIVSSEPLMVQAGGSESGPKLSRAFYDIFHAIFESGERGGLNDKLKGHLLDLDKMSPQSKMVPMCMDLMMYDSPELFEAAFSLLHAQFTQRKPLIEAMKNVELLNTVNIIPNKPDCDLASITQRVQHLRRLVESYEAWALSNSFSSDDESSHKELIDLCLHFVDFCMHDHSELGALSTDEVMRTAWPMESRSQNILRSLGLHECLLEAIAIPFRQYPAGESRRMLQTTVNVAFEALAAFVLDNRHNQDLITDEFVLIMKLVESADQTGPIEAILGPLVYRNTAFVDGLDDATLERFTGLLARRPLNTPHLMALYNQVVLCMTSSTKRHAFSMAVMHQPLQAPQRVAAAEADSNGGWSGGGGDDEQQQQRRRRRRHE